MKDKFGREFINCKVCTKLIQVIRIISGEPTGYCKDCFRFQFTTTKNCRDC